MNHGRQHRQETLNQNPRKGTEVGEAGEGLARCSCLAVWPGASHTTSLGQLPQRGSPVLTGCTCAVGFWPPPLRSPPTVEPPGLPVYSRPLSRLGGGSLGLLCSPLPSSPTSAPPARPSGPSRPRLRGAVRGRGHLRPPPPQSTLSLRP